MKSAEAGGALCLLGGVAQFLDATLWIPLGAVLLVSIAAFVVMRLYLRAVFRESQRSASFLQASPCEKDEPRPVQPAAPLEVLYERLGGPISPSPAQSSTFQHAERAFYRAAYVYVLGGSIHVAISVGLLFLFRFYSLPSAPSRLTILACCAAVFWSWFCCTMVGLALFWGPDRRFRGLLMLGYVLTLPAIGVLLQLAGAPALSLATLGMMSKEAADAVVSFASAVTGQPVSAATLTVSPRIQPILFWSLSGFPMTIPLLAFNRLVRGTVGPLFITLSLMMVLSTFLFVDLVLFTSPGLWLARHIRGLFGASTLAVLRVMSLTLSAIFAWLALLLIARSYRLKQFSDQTFLFDALWLSVSFWLSVYLMRGSYRFGYLLGLLPFAVYKIVVRYGLKRFVAATETLPKARLLFLRVFGSSSRSEKLFDLLAARWRYAGSVELISSTDLARGRFEPDEFLDFISGRIGGAYISSGADLDRRLADLDLRPDPDGRRRVNEFFCRANNWQQAVTKLMVQSDLIVMDLRTFTSEKKGILFELGVLVDVVPLQHVVLLTDQTTDEPQLRRTLTDLWRRMNPQSPNASRDAMSRVRVMDLSYGYRFAVRRLLQIGDEVIGAAA